MNYKIINWNGKKYFELKLEYWGGEVSEYLHYLKELKLNLKYQIK